MIEIERTNSDNKDFQKLILHLDADLDNRDREAHSICAQYNNKDTIKHVIVAYEDNNAIGCGAIREYASDTIEIKRMFVEENKRGKGLASLILNELERWSKELRYKTAILETGIKFADAIRLYEKNNYSRIANYGQYKAIESSICFAKELTTSTLNKMHTTEEKKEAFARLLDIMDELRIKCPWDAKQTNESLRTNTIEETYELCEAIIKGDDNEIKKELGDVLLHVIFYSKIGSEKEAFDIADVCNALCDKLIYRHPHVFGDDASKTAGEVEKSWEQLKLKEKGGNKTVLEGVPASLPSIAKAHRIQDKARNAGFDWEKKEDVWDKVSEEFRELKAEINKMDADKMEAEFGDLFFSLINAARLYRVNPDNALERTNQKFIRRFNYIEQETKKQGRNLKDMTLGEMDTLWNEAKAKE